MNNSIENMNLPENIKLKEEEEEEIVNIPNVLESLTLFCTSSVPMLSESDNRLNDQDMNNLIKNIELTEQEEFAKMISEYKLLEPVTSLNGSPILNKSSDSDDSSLSFIILNEDSDELSQDCLDSYVDIPENMLYVCIHLNCNLHST